jgi:beta-lactamase regulating signal transducer with metallopeptidase domain
MRYYVLLGLLSAGAYAAGAIVTASLVTIGWSRCRRAFIEAPARQRAQLLWALRAAPFAVGLMCSLTLSGVFLRFEPRTTNESPGLTLIAATALALVLLMTAAARVWQSIAAGRQCARVLQTCRVRTDRTESLPVWIVDTEYPIAAVTGVLRPRLLVSTRILHECPPEEMDAILRHEAAHIRRHDNLLRAFMMSTPDPLQFGGTGRAIQSAWAAAAEQAADDEAVGNRPEARADLAAALVRVARMVQGPPPAWANGVAFYEGSNLEERVQRLLAPGPAGRRARMLSAAAALLIIAAIAVVAADPIASRVHTVMEAAVNHLP